MIRISLINEQVLQVCVASYVSFAIGKNKQAWELWRSVVWKRMYRFVMNWLVSIFYFAKKTAEFLFFHGDDSDIATIIHENLWITGNSNWKRSFPIELGLKRLSFWWVWYSWMVTYVVEFILRVCSFLKSRWMTFQYEKTDI